MIVEGETTITVGWCPRGIHFEVGPKGGEPTIYHLGQSEAQQIAAWLETAAQKFALAAVTHGNA